MMKVLNQARAAVSLLSPVEVRRRADRRVTVGLVAATDAAYDAMESFLAAAGDVAEKLVYRAVDPHVPETVDVVFYEAGVRCPAGTYVLDPADPAATVAAIVKDRDELALPLARQFPGFRPAVVDHIIQDVARENAFFAVATALPDVVPNLIELPWALGEFASDTVFLTANQVRMAFLIAAACGGEVGVTHQKAAVLSIVAGAFGWRALARELVGKIPLGGGLIPKGAIAYAGTYAVGKGLEYYHHAHKALPRGHFKRVYRRALERGRFIAESLVPKRPHTEPRP